MSGALKEIKTKNDSERKIADLFSNLGFTYLDSNAIITNSSNKEVGEIDLLFVFENCLFIIEVSEKKRATDKIINFFNKWSDRENLVLLSKRYKLGPRTPVRIYFDLSVTTSDEQSSEIQRMTKHGTDNKIAYFDDYEYFFNCHKKIGTWAKNDILDWLEVDDDTKTKVIDAIHYYIGNVPVFCFAARVNDLLKTCYVSRRRTKDMGYQRTLKERRVDEVSYSIEKGEGLAFPNSILINVPEISQHQVPPEECPKVVKIHFPQSYSTCRIIDGQHRLLGFSKLSEEIQRSYCLPVIALENSDRSLEIKTFVDINSKQQRIDGNLILLLKADLEWEKDTKEFLEKIAVKVAEELNRSFFKHRVYFGKADELKGDKITLTTLVSAMIKNEFVAETKDTTYKNIHQIFMEMEKQMPDHPLSSSSYFGQNRGIKVLFRLLKLLQRNIEAQNLLVARESFFQDLGNVFDDETRKELDTFYGEGGAQLAASSLIAKMREKYPKKYVHMESDLRALRTR